MATTESIAEINRPEPTFPVSMPLEVKPANQAGSRIEPDVDGTTGQAKLQIGQARNNVESKPVPQENSPVTRKRTAAEKVLSYLEPDSDPVDTLEIANTKPVGRKSESVEAAEEFRPVVDKLEVAAEKAKPRIVPVVRARETEQQQKPNIYAEAPTKMPAQRPTITVSIGRIEVRAVMPPGSPVTTPTPRLQPTLSLDDYLRERTEGRR